MLKNKSLILSQWLRAGDRKTRGLAALGLALLFGGVAAFGTVEDPADETPIVAQTVIDSLALPGLPVVSSTDNEVYWREERFARGDTFAAFLARLGANAEQATLLVRKYGHAKVFRLLGPNQSAQAEVTRTGEVLALRLVPSRDVVVGLKRKGDGFEEFEQQLPLTRAVKMAVGEIKSSLFAATDDAGLPDAVAIQIAEIFSGDLDFHRDVRRGDRFSVVYEVFYHGGQAFKSGRVMAAEYVSSGRRLRAVWFEDQSGRGGYYAPDGKNLRKAFLRSPLEFSRVSSGFSMRFHPVLNEWRRHKGVDYAAPTGTRIRATADGVVDFMGQQNGYGNVVVLRHHSGITTLYAHLSRFGEGMRRGKPVAQGDTIGHVGSTGWATGPHVHYEFKVHNQHRNPLTVAMPSADPVPANKMRAFKNAVASVGQHLDFLGDVQVASFE